MCIRDRFYIDRHDGHVERLMEKYHIERTKVYSDKDEAVSYTHLDVYKRQMESFFLWKAGKSVTKQCGLAAMAPRKGFEKCNFPRNFGVTFPKIKVTKVTLSESGCNFKNKKVTGKVTPKVTPLALSLIHI